MVLFKVVLMTLKKRSSILAIVILVLLSVLLFAQVRAYGADTQDLTIFTDKESSIKELKLKVEQARKSIVLVIAYDDTGTPRWRGSGVFIDSDGRIITNAFTMKDAYSAEVYSMSNHYREVLILDRREDIDLAIIKVQAIDEEPLELDFQSEVKPGERVIAIGQSASAGTTVSEGLVSTVSSIGEIDNLLEIDMTKPLLSNRPSISGSILNMAGKVIGITTSVISNARDSDGIPRDYYGEKLFAISASSLKPLDKNEYKIEHLHPLGSRIWHRYLIQRVKIIGTKIFIKLYMIGFVPILVMVFVLIVFISIVEWLFSKFRKRISRE